MSAGVVQAARRQGACRPGFARTNERVLKAPARAATSVTRAVAQELADATEPANGAVPAAQTTTKKLPKSAPPFVLDLAYFRAQVGTAPAIA